MSSVLVTGASGFLGKQVLRSLLKRRYSVHAIGRKYPTQSENVRLTWHSLDLMDREATRTAVKEIRPEGLIHLAWETEHGAYWQSKANLDWLAASLQLLQDFSNSGGRRAVVAGSSAEYHWGGTEHLNETHSPIGPESIYGASKNALRQVLEQWGPRANVSWAWGRFFNVFGPGENAARLLPRIICQLLSGKRIPFDSGSLLRDFMHVEDASDALVALFGSDVQGPVNIASGSAYSIRCVLTMIEIILAAQGKIQFESVNDIDHQPPFVVADTSRLARDVGWNTSISLEDRLYDTCEWWRLSVESNGAI